MKTLRLLVFGLLPASLIMSACESDSAGNEMAELEVYLVDAPADFEEVIVDIEDVQINIDGNPEGWTTLDEFRAGTLDLLKLTNGNQAFLGKLTIPQGQLREVRIRLGERNTLRVQGEDVPLTFQNQTHREIRITLDAIITKGVIYKLVFDFDAGQSIRGNQDAYQLRPVVRARMQTLSGHVKGKIVPNHIRGVVYGIVGYDTISTYPDENGAFMFQSMEPGIYQIMMQPTESSGLSPVIVEDVIVSVGRTTDVGNLRFPN